LLGCKLQLNKFTNRDIQPVKTKEILQQQISQISFRGEAFSKFFANCSKYSSSFSI